MNRFHTLSEMSSPAQDSTSTSASSTDMSSHEQAETNRFLSLTGRTSLDDSQSGTDAELWGDAASQTATAELESTSADPITEALSSFVASYMAIPVIVGTQADGTPIVVNVQAPYAHMGTSDDTWTTAHSKLSSHPVYNEMDDAGELHYAAWDSHATPEQMRTFLQGSVDQGLVGTTAAEMRTYLVDHNFTVDCSSFVGLALEEMGFAEENRGWSQNYEGGEGISPADALTIRPGDVMVRPEEETGIGHIRMVMDVEDNGDTILFSTAESTGSSDVTNADQGSGYGSVGVVWWQFSKSGGWSTLQRSASGKEGPWSEYTSTDQLYRIDALHEAPMFF